jgi:hypothetical protein
VPSVHKVQRLFGISKIDMQFVVFDTLCKIYVLLYTPF